MLKWVVECLCQKGERGKERRGESVSVGVWGGGGGRERERERERILPFFKAATKGFNGRDFICPFVMFTAVEQRLIC